MGRIYDVSLPITEALVTYPGDPPIRVRPHQRIAEGDDADVTELSFGSHTGTHVDAPRHFLDGGRPVDAIPLDRFIGPAVVLEIAPDATAIGEPELEAAGGTQGATRVLLKTRNAELLGRDSFERGYAHLTEDGARHLLAAGVELVGIDYLSVEAFDAEEPRVHRLLLKEVVVIVEGLDLRDVAPGRYELICLPLKLAGLDGAPARAVLRAPV